MPVRYLPIPPAPVIKFYSTGDEFGEFSNFAGFPIRPQNWDRPTTEHYFQRSSSLAPATSTQRRFEKLGPP